MKLNLEQWVQYQAKMLSSLVETTKIYINRKPNMKLNFPIQTFDNTSVFCVDK